ANLSQFHVSGIPQRPGELERRTRPQSYGHHMGSGASGSMPGHEDKMPFGNRPNGLYIPRFRNVDKKHKDFIRGYGYQGGGSREGWRRGLNKVGLGVDFKHSLKSPGRWSLGMGGFGECLPNHNNYVEVDKEQTDAWGIR